MNPQGSTCRSGHNLTDKLCPTILFYFFFCKLIEYPDKMAIFI